MSLLNKKTGKSLKTDAPDQCRYQWNCRAQRDCSECAVIAGPATSRGLRRRSARDGEYCLYRVRGGDRKDIPLGTFETREAAEAEMARVSVEASAPDGVLVIRRRTGASGE